MFEELLERTSRLSQATYIGGNIQSLRFSTFLVSLILQLRACNTCEPLSRSAMLSAGHPGVFGTVRQEKGDSA